MARIMAVDYGDARIGVALTDPMQIVATGFETIPNNAQKFIRIIEILKEKKVEFIVMGIPFDQNSKIGPAAEKVLRFTQELLKELETHQLNLPVFEQDERYTTRIAHDAMRTTGVKKKKKKGVVDQIAATNILKEFMNSKYRNPLTYDKISELLKGDN
ncbi:MAG: Holliday junction resolvase RuvX [Spirochaetes bacterium]|nr:Holliday junction resolvase RuvX [Spirochaetota bacterium]